jgi:hypothetical protein
LAAASTSRLDERIEAAKRLATGPAGSINGLSSTGDGGARRGAAPW